MRFSVFVCAVIFTQASFAVLIELEETFYYRGKPYKAFDSKNISQGALRAICTDRAQTDPENVARIRQAIDDGDVKHHRSFAYFNPPLKLEGELRHQLNIHSSSAEKLRSVLDAIETQNEPKHAHEATRIRKRLATRETNEPNAQAPESKKRARISAHSDTDADEEIVVIPFRPSILDRDVTPEQPKEYDLVLEDDAARLFGLGIWRVGDASFIEL